MSNDLESKVNRLLHVVTDLKRETHKTEFELQRNEDAVENVAANDQKGLSDLLITVDKGLAGVTGTLMTEITRNSAEIANNRASAASAARLAEINANAVKVNSETLKKLIADLRTMATELKSTNADIYHNIDMPTNIEIDSTRMKIVRNYVRRLRVWKSRLVTDDPGVYGTDEYTDQELISIEDVIPKTVEMLVTCVSDEVTSGSLTDYVATNPGDKVTKVVPVLCSFEVKMTTGALTDIGSVDLDVPYGPAAETAGFFTKLKDFVLTGLHVAEAFGWEVDPEFAVGLEAIEGIADTVAGAVAVIDGFRAGNPSDLMENITATEAIALTADAPVARKVKSHSHSQVDEAAVLITNVKRRGTDLTGAPAGINNTQLETFRTDIVDGHSRTIHTSYGHEVKYSRGFFRTYAYRRDADLVDITTGLVPLSLSSLARFHGGIAKAVLVPQMATFSVPNTTKTIFFGNTLYAYRSLADLANSAWTYKASPSGFTMLRTNYVSTGFSTGAIVNHYADM